MKSTTIALSKDSIAGRLEKIKYSIINISYLNEDSTKKSPRSVMNNFKILVMMSGSASIYMGRDVYYCKKGDCVLFAPGSLYHAEISGPEKCSFISVNFSVEQPTMEKSLKTLTGLRDIAIYPSLVPEHTTQYLWQVFEGVAKGREGSYHNTDLLLRRLIGIIAYTRPAITQTKDRKHSLGREQLVLYCHRYIVNNPELPVTVADLCRLCNVSQSYMYKSFRTVTDMSTKDFITHTKLDIAARALLHTDKTVARIAAENGYSTAYRFSALFKKHYGMSPAIWRRENR